MINFIKNKKHGLLNAQQQFNIQQPVAGIPVPDHNVSNVAMM